MKWNGKRLILKLGIVTNLFFLPGWSVESTPLIRHIYLTCQNDPSHNMTINIHGLNTPDQISIYFDTEPRLSKVHSYKKTIKVSKSNALNLPDSRKIYHLELNQLIPGTTYYFTIGDAYHAWISEQKFCTISEGGEDITLIEGGDWENTPNAEILAEWAGKQKPALVLLGGDYATCFFDQNDYKRWDKWLDTFDAGLTSQMNCHIPMVLAIGNHEVLGGFGQSKLQAPYYFNYFPQGKNQKSYFSLSLGSRIKLFVLDSGHVESHSGEQLNWLEQELRNSSSIPIKMALYHVPLYPSVRFAEKNFFYKSIYNIVELFTNASKAQKLFSFESKEGRRCWLPLFDKYSLTVAFEHHDQTLKRTKLLKNNNEHPYGTLYLGDGGWGAKVQYPPIQSFFNSHFAKVQGMVHFFWIVNIKKDCIYYQAMDVKGNILDEFTQSIIVN